MLGRIALVSMVIGFVLALICGAQLRSRSQGTPEPAEVTVAALGQRGPIDNIHVTLTDFRRGDITAMKGARGVGKRGWAPLLQADGMWPPRAVFALLPDVANEDDAAAQLDHNALTGILVHGLPRSVRERLGPSYPAVDLADAVYLRVGGTLPSLPLNLSLCVVGLFLIAGGAVTAAAQTWASGIVAPEHSPAAVAKRGALEPRRRHR